MSQEHKTLWQEALYYDIAFQRDIGREVEFIPDLYRHHVGAELRSVADLACGPGFHARALAQRGIRAIGLDNTPEMLALARQRVEEEGANVTWFLGDMCNFQLECPVDMALCMLDSMDYLLTDEELVQHFRTVAVNLTQDGLYLIHFTDHPRDWHYEDYYGAPIVYTGGRDCISVEIHWGTNNPLFDPVTGIAQVEIEIHVNDHGHEQVIHKMIQERMGSPNEYRLAAEISGALQVVGWYGDFDLNQPLDNSPAAKATLIVLQKKEG